MWISTMGTSRIKRQRIRRRVYLEVPGFLGLAAIVTATDLIATVPRTIGEALAAGGSIRVLPCPVRAPGLRRLYAYTTQLRHAPMRARTSAVDSKGGETGWHCH